MRVITLTVLGFVLLAAAPVLQAQDWVLKTAEAVLEANIKATGGADAWAKIKTMRIDGAVEFESPMGGTRTGSFVEHVKLPGYSHRESSIEGPMGQQTQTYIEW